MPLGIAAWACLAALLAAPAFSQTPTWWDAAYGYRRKATVTAGAQALDAGAAVGVTLDHAALVGAGKSQADGDDVRVARWNGASWTEVGRTLDSGQSWNAATTSFRFALQAALAAGASDSGYYVYYGNPAATAPAVGSARVVVKSVQSGTAQSNAEGVLTIPITAVDRSRAFLMFTSRHNSNRPVGSAVMGQLATATTVTFTRNSNEAPVSAIDISWTVVEYQSGVTVQHGATAQTSTATNVVLAQALQSTAQAFLIWSKVPVRTDSSWGGDDIVVSEMISTTTLQFRAASSNAGHTIAWQVVEFENSADVLVQRGSVFNLGGGTTSTAVTLGTAVDLGKSFVLIDSYSSASNVNIGKRLLRARLTDATTITIDRSETGQVIEETTWQVVYFRDGTTVQAGNANFPQGTATVNAAITAVDTARSFAIGSLQHASGQNMGRSNYTGDDILGVTAAQMTFANATTLTLTRSSTVDNADVAWFVIQMAQATNSTLCGEEAHYGVTAVCAGLSTAETGTSDSFSFSLTSPPMANVTITISSSDATEAGVSPTTLTFTAANWNTPQTVTVTGVDDFKDDGNQIYTISLGALASADANFNGFDPADVTGTTTDNDSAGVVVTSAATLNTTEAGGTATFTMKLGTEPDADVVIALSSSDLTEGTISPASLTFTAANWSIAQTATLTGVDDFVNDGDVAYTVAVGAAVSADAVYSGLDPADIAASNADDDPPGVTVTPAAGLVTTEQGGAATFTIVLQSLPAANVTITLAVTDLSEGTVAPASLTFTAADWSTPQTVTVTGVDDFADDGDIAYLVTTTAASADPDYHGVAVTDPSLTNTDNDAVAVVLAGTTGLSVTEAGSSATFTVVLGSQPSADVTITATSGDAGEVSAAPGTLTFTAANWSTARTVTLTGVNDAVDDGDQTSSITFTTASADAAYHALAIAAVTVITTDDDSAGTTVTPISGLVTTEQGGAATFTVVLTSQPTADVSIAVASNDATEAVAAPATLLFTAANWSSAQTVTVTGVDDAQSDGAIGYTVVLSAAVSADAGYNAMNPSDVTGVTTDNDPGLVSTPISALVTTEAGAAAQFSLRLAFAPSADVTLPVASADATEGVASPASLTFTAANWNTPRIVTVTGVDDLIDDGDLAYNVTIGPAQSADATWNGFSPPSVSLTNVDNDDAGVVVTPASAQATTESGAQAAFTLALATQPTANVTITLVSSDLTEGTVSPASLTFTAVNWATPQAVVITGVDDAAADSAVAYVIQTDVTSADGAYHAIAVLDLPLENADNDSPGFLLTATGAGHSVTEGGAGDSFLLVLRSQPTADVTISFLANTQLTPAPATVTFTAANWSTPRTISLSAIDDAVVEGAHTATLFLQANTADVLYGALALPSAVVSLADNDSAALSITPSGADTRVTEGGATDSYDLALTSQPMANVTVTLAGDGKVSVAPLVVVFTAATWNVPQRITVSAVDDALAEGLHYGSVTHSIASADAVYSTLTPSTALVAITDNDSAGFDLTESGGASAVVEGGVTDTLTLRLNSQPTSDVVVSFSTGAEITVSPATLTFSAAAWSSARTVTLSAVDDALVEGAHQGTLSATVTSADTDYAALSVPLVTVSITDNDAAGVILAESDGATTVTEGGAADVYTLALASQPTATVVIAISVPGGQCSPDPATVTFTSANWSLPQAITITATQDDVPEGPHWARIDHAVASGDTDYQGLTVADLWAQIADDADAVVIQSAVLADADGDGNLDGAVLTFNVPIDSASFNGAGFTLGGQNAVAALDPLDPTIVRLSLPTGGVVGTGAVEVGFDAAIGHVGPNASVSLGAITASDLAESDAAAPVLLRYDVADSDGDGDFDRVEFTFSESIDAASFDRDDLRLVVGGAEILGGLADSVFSISGPTLTITLPESAQTSVPPAYRLADDGDGRFLADASGNQTAPRANTGPPVVTASADSPAPPGVVFFTASAVDPDGTAVTLSFAAQPGNPEALVIADAGGGRYRFEAVPDGSYGVTVLATDAIGEQSAPVTVTIVVQNLAPAAIVPDTLAFDAARHATIALDASASTDPNQRPGAVNEALRFSWAQLSGPSGVALDDPALATPTFPTLGLSPGVFVFEVTVTDNDGASDTARQTLLVELPPPLRLPRADAGLDQVRRVGEAAALSGAMSRPGAGAITLHRWRQISGPADAPLQATVADASEVTFTASKAGVFVFELVVVNDGGFSSPPDLVRVLAVKTGNLPPSADAGDDRSANSGETVALDGSRSLDPERGALAYSWTQVFGPAATLENAGAVAPRFIPVRAGQYRFSLSVTDEALQHSLPDAVTVLVASDADHPPVADAGPDQERDLGAVITLDGGRSGDADGDALAYFWTQVEGPPALLDDPRTEKPSWTPTEAGSYLFDLVVSDGRNFSPADRVGIVVHGANRVPAAKFEVRNTESPYGLLMITLDGRDSLDASGDLDRGGADVVNAASGLRFFWVQERGPVLVTPPWNAETFAFETTAEGRYVFALWVDDGENRSLRARKAVDVSVEETLVPLALPDPSRRGKGGGLLGCGSRDASDPPDSPRGGFPALRAPVFAAWMLLVLACFLRRRGGQ